MQTCSRCNTQSSDETILCPVCQVELAVFSTSAVSLVRMQVNPRISKIRIAVNHDACPACKQMQQVYYKNNVPSLPVQGCSHQYGCRCYYEPVLDEIYP